MSKVQIVATPPPPAAPPEKAGDAAENVVPEPAQSSVAKNRKNLPEKRKIPATRLARAKVSVEFSTTLFCQRFLRSVTAILGVQYLTIFALLMTAILSEKAANLVVDKWQLWLILHSACYCVIAVSLILLNKVYRKAGLFNYVPLAVITVNIAGLLSIPVVQFKLWGIAAVTGAIGLYGILLSIFQLCSWELSLFSGLLGIIVGNTLLGSGALAVLFHRFGVKCPSQVFFILEAVTTGVMGYFLYDLELMTSDPGVHRLLEYGIVYNSEAYGTLHLSVDLVHALIKIPKYVFGCCKVRCRKGRCRQFVGRSCLGFGWGKPYPKGGSPADSEEETETKLNQ